jgi:hypothetical protein
VVPLIAALCFTTTSRFETLAVEEASVAAVVVTIPTSFELNFAPPKMALIVSVPPEPVAVVVAWIP